MSSRKRNRRRNRRRNRKSRRGGKGKGAAKRHSARHGRTDAQMRAAAARRRKGGLNVGKIAKKTMHSARRPASHRVTRKRSRLGPPPKGHAPPPPKQKDGNKMVWRTNPLYKGKSQSEFKKIGKWRHTGVGNNPTTYTHPDTKTTIIKKHEDRYKKSASSLKPGNAGYQQMSISSKTGLKKTGLSGVGQHPQQFRLRRSMGKTYQAPSRPAFCNRLDKKSQMYKKKCMGPGKAAAKQAGQQVAEAVHQAAKQAATAAPAIIKKALKCPAHCAPIAGGSRRRRRRRRGGGMTGIFARRRSRRRR